MGLVDSVKKGLQKAKDEAQDLAQITRLKGEISRLKGRRQQMFFEIGREVFELHQKGEPLVGFGTRCDAIAGIEQEIAMKEQEIQAIRDDGPDPDSEAEDPPS